MAQQNENLSFEENLERLEKIVVALEKGEAPLAESLSLYEEGIGLVNRCNEELDKAEAKIKVLSRNNDGEMTENNFVGD